MSVNRKIVALAFHPDGYPVVVDDAGLFWQWDAGEWVRSYGPITIGVEQNNEARHA